MFLLINIYSSKTTSAYVAGMDNFESYDEAIKEMKKTCNGCVPELSQGMGR